MTLMPLSGTLLLTIPRPLLLGYRVHTLICRGSGLPLFFLLSPAHPHDAPFAKRLLAWAVQLYQIHLRIVRLNAAYWGLPLIAWIHAVLGAVAVIPWNRHSSAESLLFTFYLYQRRTRKTQWHRALLWTRFSLLLSPTPSPVWQSEIASQVALTYAASVFVGLAAEPAGRPDLIRSPKRVLAHL